MFFYVIWWTEYEQNTEKNHWGILDLKTLQSRSHFIFRINESWRWLSSVIDALKMGKTVKKNPQSIFDLELAIFKVKGLCGNFLTIFFILSAWNCIEIPSQTFMTNETTFLHCTLRTDRKIEYFSIIKVYALRRVYQLLAIIFSEASICCSFRIYWCEISVKVFLNDCLLSSGIFIMLDSKSLTSSMI